MKDSPMSTSTAPLSLPQLRTLMFKEGLKVFETGAYNLNLVGVRNMSKLHENKFNDWFYCFYKDVDGYWSTHRWACTTDPGTYWRLHPTNPKGTAILAPGQYRAAYMLGKHKGKYEALVQQGKMPVAHFRDSDRNEDLNFTGDLITDTYIGANIHRASATTVTENVNKYSAACQVIQNPLHFYLLIALAKLSSSIHGPYFTYTLLEI